jgi:site-specific recombinase XerD
MIPNPSSAINAPESALNLNEAEFRGWMRNSGLAAKTISDYCRALVRYRKFLRDNPDVPLRRAFTCYRATPGMTRVLGFALRRLQTFLGEVCDTSVEFGVPARLANPSRPRPRPITTAELLLLMRTARRILGDRPKQYSINKVVRAWLFLAQEWGTRLGEAVLTWPDIDLDAGDVQLDGKTGEGWAPISARGSRVLRYLKRLAPSSAGPFIGSRGQLMSADYLYRLFHRVAHAANLQVRPHHLRHRAVTRWGEMEIPMPYLMRLSRHRSVSAVLWYLQPSQEKLRAYAAGRHLQVNRDKLE